MPSPPLDARTLADVLARLSEEARQTLPAWTPPPEGDAGTALHRIFARFVEIGLTRLNGVPDKTLLTFLDAMGVSPLPASAARTPLVFGLAPGSDATLVPAGTQVSAPAAAARPEVVFETEQDLMVLPATLAAARVVDPVWDRASDLTGRAGPVFAGDTPLAHVLHAGDDLLTGPSGLAVYALTFRYTTYASEDSVRALFDSLVVSCRTSGTTRTLSPTVSMQGNGTVSLQGRLPLLDTEEVTGVGLAVSGRWLHLALPVPHPDAAVPGGLRLHDPTLDVEVGALVPDTVLAGTALADPTRDFLPFGDRPQVGDVMYLRADQAFAQPMTVSLIIKAGGGTATADLALTWEYLGTDGWTAVGATASPAGAGTLTADGAVTLALPPVPIREVAGRSGRWVRARITKGGYGTPVEYVPVNTSDPSRGFQVKPGTGNLAPPRLRSVTLSYVTRTVPHCVVQAGDHFEEAVPSDETGFAPFPGLADLPAPYADPGPALYLGFDGLSAQQALTLYAEVPARELTRPGGDPPGGADPAGTRWEYFDGRRWQELTVFDGTSGFTVSGSISLVTPVELAGLARFDPVTRVWLRVRSAADDPAGSRRISALYANAVLAAAAVTVSGEVLGSSSGQQGQVFTTARRDVQPGQELFVAESETLPADEAETLAAEEGPGAVAPATLAGVQARWHEVPDFGRSAPADRHYTLDRSTGTVRFGDGVRGLIPPRGTSNLTMTYRAGGGASGNVPAASAGQLRTPVPGIATVTNPSAADGGSDGEPLDQVRERGAHTLRHRDRAVTAEDVEWLVRQATGGRVARAVCLPNTGGDMAFAPGWVTVLVVPDDTGPTPEPAPELVREVGDYLAARASVSLTGPAPGRISVIGPAYVRVTVDADLVPRVLADADQVTRRAVAALGAFFHPVTGGPGGTGWTLGRPVYASEVAQLLENVDGVSHVQTLSLRPNLAQRRLTLASAPVAVAPAAYPAGTRVAAVDGRCAGPLALAIAAGTQVRRIDVTGFREGDQVTFAADLVVEATDSGGRVHARLVRGSLAAGLPRGSTIVGPGGYRSRLRGGIAPGTTATLTVVPEDASPVTVGESLTVLHPFPATVSAVDAGTSGQVELTVAPIEAPPGDGAIVSTLGGQVRAPLVAASSAPGETAITRLTVGDFADGQTITVGGSLTAVAERVATVSDHVHLDPYVFAYSAGHRIRIRAV
ncbi:putative baseplate assembly protein [Actinomadura sp. DC4]|uniref:putative baseplate assembly protein n=1 Tax=Actinomadura sp. DC4 TaxID=3055069 RepID=UPI0025B20EFE|nr:putative baseplate assembly protein [Actinomadura sp. DC4]MDN3354885.1 putative baseplate assembly protein [Actinomadura sp. DC4]